jgi:hypothetical protein
VGAQITDSVRSPSKSGDRSGPPAPGPPGSDRIIEIEPHDPRWEAFVAGHPDGLIYHHPAWLQILERESGQKTICLASEDGARGLTGILPLSWTKGLPLTPRAYTGRRLSSLPRTPVAGPLSLRESVTSALIQSAIELVRDAGGARLELKPSWTSPKDFSADGIYWLPWRKAYTLTLAPRIEDIRLGTSRNRARIKWAIRKANRLRVVVRRAETHQDLRIWYGLYLETMRKATLPPRPFRFFEVMWSSLLPLGLMRLLLAQIDGRVVAGSIYLMYGRTVFYAFNGCRRSDLSLRPNDVIQWQAIEDFCREGFCYYDLGEVSLGNFGLAEFKAKWGSDERQLYRYYHPRPEDMRLDRSPSTSAPRRLLEAAWQRVPLGATSAVGNAVYRFM